MKTLIINSHPDYQNKKHYSYEFQEHFLTLFKQKCPSSHVEILNLYENDIPRIENGQLLSIWNKKQQDLTPEEQQIAKTSQALLTQFKAYKRIVLIMPLHNFNVESRMKDYIDNILIARETFKYTENGSEGLMTDDYKLLVIQSSGSIYTNEDRYQKLDISHLYLQGIFKEIMGFSAVDMVRVEGTAILPKKEIITKGLLDLNQAFDNFYA